MESLKDKHKNETAWIIGKGPSLQYLKKEDIGDGVVITINEAIVAIGRLGLKNHTYSLQKDGGAWKKPTDDNLSPDCDYSGERCESCQHMVTPKEATLLLHDLESAYCFPDYTPRYVLNLQRLGLPGNVFSMIFALKAAQYMGCKKIKFVSFDAHAKGDFRAYTPGETARDDEEEAGLYRGQTVGIKPHLEGVDYEWITPGEKKKNLKISFGVLVNNIVRLDMVLRQSQIKGEMHFVKNPESATKGLNILLDLIEKEGADVAVLTHQDMYYRDGWLSAVREQLAKLPESWVVAGIIGKDMKGRIAGVFRDMRIPLHFNTSHIHYFPQPACCFDECCIIVNMKSGFRFDEVLDGFDLYGTLCVLQTWEMRQTAWIIDAPAEHYCLRPFTWHPDRRFKRNYKMLYNRYRNFIRIDSTALGLPAEAQYIKELGYHPFGTSAPDDDDPKIWRGIISGVTRIMEKIKGVQ